VKNRLIAAGAAVVLTAAVVVVSAQNGEREAIRQAALDYVEGIYTVQPQRIERSVHPALVKRGFYRKDPGGPYVESPMTYEQLVNLASNWNKSGTRDTKVKKVEVLDALDQTAVAKVTASWGVDYLLLGRYDGKWKISQIIWQSPPPAK
jgi:hypothetical protein